MPQEIERKFLVASNAWREHADPVLYRQGYWIANEQGVVRIRRAGAKGILTLKTHREGISRLEYEFEIPSDQADDMLKNLCGPLVEKQRHRIEYQSHIWEVDEFLGANAPLILAEIELQSEDESFAHPAWLGPEVSHDRRYFNEYLSRHPYSTWPENQ